MPSFSQFARNASRSGASGADSESFSLSMRAWRSVVSPALPCAHSLHGALERLPGFEGSSLVVAPAQVRESPQELVLGAAEPLVVEQGEGRLDDLGVDEGRGHGHDLARLVGVPDAVLSAADVEVVHRVGRRRGQPSLEVVVRQVPGDVVGNVREGDLHQVQHLVSLGFEDEVDTLVGRRYSVRQGKTPVL
jgi:hypothetical protein